MEDWREALRTASGREIDERAARAAATIVADAEAAWPQLRVDPVEFARVLGGAIETADDPAAALEQLRASDLRLAMACIDGQRPALEELDRHLDRLRPNLGRMGLTGDQLEDFLQETRMRLLASGAERPPRLRSYQGRAQLAAWLKVVVVRDAVRAVRRAAKRSPADAEIDALMDPAGDPEAVTMKERYAEAFRAAFSRALEGLSTRDRNVLRFHLVEGLSIDELGAMYRVHRATAARWLVRIRERLFASTRTEMVRVLAGSHRDFDSVMRLIQSRMHASIGRHL